MQHKSFFLTDVVAPLCAISNLNYEQVNPRNFPAAMLFFSGCHAVSGGPYCDRHLADSLCSAHSLFRARYHHAIA